ncbi:MAG: hypothetical protein HY736_12345 [Verrucomicrobia bacterium]|nr:hypothetical protein [Verrucomicrobiota bacterium]
MDITNRNVPLVNDPLFVKALVVGNETTRAVIVTVDAVAVAEIGTIKNDYVANVRAQLKKDLKLEPANILFNASHCHGVVCADVEQRTVAAVKEAWGNLVPVTVGAGSGRENRVMENRRVRLKNGREADVRHAYSLPPDEEVAGIGPVDPEIGVLRFDRKSGQTLAVVYNFACHPIQSVPNGGNSADVTGFASRLIEDNLSHGAIALFVQGCGGDINPVLYKDVSIPRDAEPLGNMLGLSTMQAIRKIQTRESGELKVISEILALPRADHAQRIESLQAEQTKLMQSLKGTMLNLKTFVPLIVKYNYSSEYPSSYSHRYMHDQMIGRSDLLTLDADNRRRIQDYIANIYIMEELSRMNVNLALLKKHQARNLAAGRTIEVEVMGLRIGDFRLVSFPGELTVQIGLNIKKASPHARTFVAGYSNGYIYYSPTAEQLKNVGRAQEDSDCLLAPEWQKIYEEKALEMLKIL